MKSLLVAVFSAFYSLAFGQTAVNVDKTDGLPLNAFYTVSGNPFVNYRFVRLVDGSPYFKDAWMTGIVITDNDQTFKTSRAKLDLVDNQLIFLNEKGEEFVCTLVLKEVSLTDSATNTLHRFVFSAFVPPLTSEKRGWYQQLVNGKVSLFLAHRKLVQETKPYNSGVAEQRIYNNPEFLVVYNGALLKVKKPKDLPAIFTDGRAELEAYQKKDEVKNLTAAAQMTALVNYYNTLQ